MSHVGFAEWDISNSARAVFDLGKQSLKSGQSEAALFIRFAAKNLRIQFVGRYNRMARELPEIDRAAKSSKWWRVRKDGSELRRAEY